MLNSARACALQGFNPYTISSSTQPQRRLVSGLLHAPHESALPLVHWLDRLLLRQIHAFRSHHVSPAHPLLSVLAMARTDPSWPRDPTPPLFHLHSQAVTGGILGPSCNTDTTNPNSIFAFCDNGGAATCLIDYQRITCPPF